MKTRVRKPFKFTQHLPGTSPELIMKRMEHFESNGLFRQTMFGTEIIWNKRLYTFDSKDFLQKKGKRDKEGNLPDHPKKNLFIFGLVKRDAMAYLKTGKFKPQTRLQSIHFNQNFSNTDSRIIGADLDGAYWRIAFQKGVISERTFNHGLRIDDKQLCLAALATLGADKTYRSIRKGRFGNAIEVWKGNDELKEVYKMIRFECYKYMQHLARILGNDYVCYKTDCIYFAHTEQNTATVKAFLKAKKLDFKLVQNFGKFKKELPQ